MTEAGTNPCDFVCCHSSANAAPADQNAAFGFSMQHAQGDSFSVVGIIHRISAVGAHIQDEVSVVLQMVAQDLFKLKSGMIRAECDLHEFIFSSVPAMFLLLQSLRRG